MALDLGELFERLVELGPEARASELAAVEDPRLRQRLEAMLAVDQGAHWLDPDPRHGLSPLVVDELSAREEELPATLGQIRVVRELGRGGMGVVYEGRQALPERAVALKTLLDPVPTEAAVRRFLDECQAMAEVDHPAVPRIHQVIMDGARPVMVMELVRGEPFSEGLAALSFDDRIRLLVELARAVHELHRAGIVHRDLKPANLLLARGGVLRILDFGIAGAGGRFIPGAGTATFVAPEQLRGDPPDPRNDVFSLGALALRALTGGSEDSSATWGTAQGPGGPVFAPQAATLPPSLAAVITSAVRLEVEARTPSAEAFAEGLEGWLEAELLRMLSATAAEVGPGGAGAVRRRAVDSTLAVLRRTLEAEERVAGRWERTEDLLTLTRWLATGARAVSVYGLPGAGAEDVVRELLRQVGEELAVEVRVEAGGLLGPLARALGTGPSEVEVGAVLRGLGAAVIGVVGEATLAEEIVPLMQVAGDVRWVLVSGTRAQVAPYRPLQLAGLPVEGAVAQVGRLLIERGVQPDEELVRAEVVRVGALPGLLDGVVEQASALGLQALAHLPGRAYGPVWEAIEARVVAVGPRLREALVGMALLPRGCREVDLREIFGAGGALLATRGVDQAFVQRIGGRLELSEVVRAIALERADPQVLHGQRASWLRWVVRSAGVVGEAWLGLRRGVHERVVALAPHVGAAVEHLDPASLHAVSASLAEALSMLGHAEVRAALDEAVLRATPDPLVSRDASLAWVHAIVRQHRRGDLRAVPSLRAIREAADPRDGGLLCQAAHVEASRYAAGQQDEAAAVVQQTWELLRQHGQEAWGAWMVAVQASVSLGLGGPPLLELAEQAVAAIRPDAPDLPRLFAQDALAVAWINHGQHEAGARLGVRVIDELVGRGLDRSAGSLSCFVGQAWCLLGRVEPAERALQRAVEHAGPPFPAFALHWLALIALEAGQEELASARLHEAKGRIPKMEHGLWHHQQLCEALAAHVRGARTEARQLYRAVIDSEANRSARRRAVALGALVLLAEEVEVREAHANALFELARGHEDGWPAVEAVLGPGLAPLDHRGVVTPMTRLLARLAASEPGPGSADLR